MRKTAIALLLFLFVGKMEGAEFTGKVIAVADGDTITVLHVSGNAKTPVKIRLAGIDTPEKKQDYGQKAKAAISAKVFGKTVRVVYTEKDRYADMPDQ